MIENRLEQAFPQLRFSAYEIKSPYTPEYNCIAWAAGENDRWWWPDQKKEYFWPEEIPRRESLEVFISAFKLLGYCPCSAASLERGFDKVAIYADENGIPKHMARQLPSGMWTSKLGPWEDIEHTLEGLFGATYVRVVQILKRPLNS